MDALSDMRLRTGHQVGVRTCELCEPDVVGERVSEESFVCAACHGAQVCRCARVVRARGSMPGGLADSILGALRLGKEALVPDPASWARAAHACEGASVGVPERMRACASALVNVT